MRPRDIPNMITFARMFILIPLVLSLIGEFYGWAFFWFFLAGLSDGLDGFLARRFNWTSQIGTLLDPMADKLLMLVTYLSLGWLGVLPVFLVALVIGRDFVILLGSISARLIIGPVDFTPSMLSKGNTVLQMALAFFTLFELAFVSLPKVFMLALMLFMIVTSLASLLNYVWVWSWRVYRETR